MPDKALDTPWELARRTAATVERLGGRVWLAGGALRDALLGLPVHDLDVVAVLEPGTALRALADGLHVSGARLNKGTVRFVAGRLSVDVATLRGTTIEADLALRDYTINAMALPLDVPHALGALRVAFEHPGEAVAALMPLVIDPFGGMGDLRSRTLRAVSGENLRDDPGRIVRGARLLARLGLTVDPGTVALAQDATPLLNTLSGDRVREELMAFFALPVIAPGVRLLAEALCWPALLRDATPEAAGLATDLLAALDRIVAPREDASPSHDLPALHTWMTRDAERAARLRTDARWAALLATTAVAGGRDGESAAGKQLAHSYHLSRSIVRAAQTVPGMVEALADGGLDLPRMRALVAAASGIGPAVLTVVVAVASVLAHPGAGRDPGVVARHADAALDLALNAPRALDPPPLLDGRDVIALGVAPGACIGELLRRVRGEQLRGSLTSRDEALRFVRAALGADH